MIHKRYLGWSTAAFVIVAAVIAKHMLPLDWSFPVALSLGYLAGATFELRHPDQ